MIAAEPCRVFPPCCADPRPFPTAMAWIGGTWQPCAWVCTNCDHETDKRKP